jgi:phosphopantothenoylcysteine decarboxylase/phosphopantothenate--cysteine ligase
MGYALAQAALDVGADVSLVSAHVGLPPPWGARVATVGTAEEMLHAVERECERADALVMAAAVADYRAESESARKLKKTGVELELRLVETPDVLASVGRQGLVKVGFAAETENLLESARLKLERKGLDLIVANDAVATLGSERAALTLVRREGVEELPELPKEEAAARVIEAVAPLLGA